MKIIKSPSIYLPNKNIDLNKWAVIACDQFTSEPSYWDKLDKLVADSPSTLRLIYPEAYLGEKHPEERIKNINATMRDYIDRGVIVSREPGMVFLERKLKDGKIRLGLLLAVDLEAYTYQKGIISPIRASEQTIAERIPPRVKIRRNAVIELPHIQVLFDDSKNEIMKDLSNKKDSFEKIYDFELNMDGGHLTGYFIKDTKELEQKLLKLAERNKNGLLFIVGDGNHSLATAKACWDEMKVNLSEKEKEDHPARYALVEAINIYDEGLTFDPIHRVVKNVDADFLPGLKLALKGNNKSWIYRKNEGKENIEIPDGVIAYKAIQKYIDTYLAEHPKAEVDYVHDVASLLAIANDDVNVIGINMPALSRGDVFDYIAKADVLPRKAFSLGKAIEKRYYFEAKRINR